MAAKLFYLPGRSAINLNGFVAAGAEIVFYTSGTTTKTPIYADASLTTELANPVVANAAGRFPDIYIDESKIYRARGTEAVTGDVLFDVDPYYPGDAAEADDALLAAAASAIAAADRAEAAAEAQLALIAGSEYADFATGEAATSVGDLFYVVDAGSLLFYKNGTSADEDDVYFTLGNGGGSSDYTSVNLGDMLTPAQIATIQAGTTPYVDVGAILEALVLAVGIINPVSTFQSAPKIKLPWGTMRFEQTVNLKRTVSIEGAGRGDNANSAPTTIYVAPDTTGFVINFNNTYDDRLETVSDPGYGYGASMSTLKDFLLRSEGGTDPTAVGIRVRHRCVLQGLNIYGFPGNNIHIYCTASSGFADRVGNCNYSLISNIRTTQSLMGNGIFVDGSDANVIDFNNIDCRSNALCGIFDAAFLGNRYGSVHTAFNGNSQGDLDTSCWYDGAKFLYIGNPTGSLGLLSGSITGSTAIQPGSDLTIWQWDGPSQGSVADTADGYTATFEMYGGYTTGSKVLYQGHRFQALSSSANSTLPMSESTIWRFVGAQGTFNAFFPEYNASTVYYQGASLWFDEANASNTVGHFYEEGSQQSYIASKSYIQGGAYGNLYGAILGSGQAWVNKGFWTSTTHTHPNGLGELTMFQSVDGWMKFKAPYGDSQGVELRSDTTTNDYRWSEGGTEFMRITSSDTTQQAGRSAAIGEGKVIFPFGLWIGSSAANSRSITSGTAAPTTGEAARGDIQLNRNPSVGGPTAWTCTTGGTNGSTSVWTAWANL